MSTELNNIDPATNARFSPMGDGTYSENIASSVQLTYNPETGAAGAVFYSEPYVKIGGVFRALGNCTDLLTVDFASNMTKLYGEGLTDPVTGASLAGISVAGMSLLLKSGMDVEFNAREATDTPNL